VNIAAARKEGFIMVAGRLQEKKGYFYIVLSFKDESGKHKTKWISTGLPVKGNKKKAEAKLLDARRSFVIPTQLSENDVTFVQFMKNWLEIVKPNIEQTTYSAYNSVINNVICPHFEDQGILLKDLQAKHIQDFYTHCLNVRGVSANTIIHYHANIRKALKYAVNTDIIPYNPADKVQRPKRGRFKGKFYDVEEVNELFNIAKGARLELPVMLAAFYGLRRGEILGLKWNAIDFENDRLTINHTVTTAIIDGKFKTIAKDRAKNNSSHRSLPLIPEFKEILIKLKRHQADCQKLCKSSYNKEFRDYIFVDDLGNLIKPAIITVHFGQALERNNMRKIRFHDLRHTCASLLLANGVSMKEIQEWLGHSDYGTTANTYAHLMVDSKQGSANAMRASGLSIIAS
jgi:integrase